MSPKVRISSPKVQYLEDKIVSNYTLENSTVIQTAGGDVQVSVPTIM